MESVFIHATVVPVETVSGLGLNAFEPSVAAPLGIEMLVDDPDPVPGGAGVGPGVGDDGYEDPLHPTTNIETTATKPTRTRSICIFSRSVTQQLCCHVAHRPFVLNLPPHVPKRLLEPSSLTRDETGARGERARASALQDGVSARMRRAKIAGSSRGIFSGLPVFPLTGVRRARRSSTPTDAAAQSADSYVPHATRGRGSR